MESNLIATELERNNWTGEKQQFWCQVEQVQ